MGNKYVFRPSARLLSTIGENLIKDIYAAVVELVKNSYDADATTVEIKFSYFNKKLIITIEDDGTGMSEDIIKNKWLVPSTDDKLIRKVTSKGRYMQGEKGIGRFSAAILGEELILETVQDGILSKMNIEWSNFSEDKYLDEVEVEIETEKTNKSNGTKFIMISNDGESMWNEENIDMLIKELKKMLTPISDKNDDTFRVIVKFENFYITKYENQIIEIDPFPLLNYYNYRIFGTISSTGKTNLVFEYRIGDKLEVEKVSEIIALKDGTDYCGNIQLDFRIFERDNDNLTQFYKSEDFIIASLDKLKVNEVKRLLDKICGISIYKNDFRIRPYGDEGYDWLELDKKRVQDPSFKIGFNQISGLIKIEPEEKSGLSEKSARDGLREDSYYKGLKMIISNIINIIEIKREKIRNGEKQKPIKELIDNSSLKEKITEVAKESGLENSVVDKFQKIIEEDTKFKEDKIEKLSKEISKYEGQATLGKIMDLIMHEIRKPLMWFKTQSITITKVYDRYQIEKEPNDLEKLVRIIEASSTHASLISDFFKKIDILATRSAESKDIFYLQNAINDSVGVFFNLFTEKDIELIINCNPSISFYGWEKDIVIALTNIIENSIYWISYSKTERKKITITVKETAKEIVITTCDTGIGISKDLLEKGMLFKPGITTKEKGTGIGLAIVGNCIERNCGKVEAYNTSEGACIEITLFK